ncbi:MAG TPA: hypothetical protein VLW52_02070 [Opitutaceae bacterium]|nr:hypothetical protein [Opitutaceae bacterium]
MLRQFTLVTCGLLVAVSTGGVSVAAAKSEPWQDSQGNRFRGEAAEVLGPLALFRTSETTGRRLAWRQLAPADCRRFYDRVRVLPPRAADWAEARGGISEELRGRVMRLEGNRLVPAELKGRPEPEFFILFFASHGEGKSWEMMGSAGPAYARLRQDYPGMVEAVFYGLRHTPAEHIDMAVGMNMSWLVTDFRDQFKLEIISRFAPADGYALVVVNRDGVPLVYSGGENEAAVKRAMDELAGLLDLMRPDNPRSWKDRAYYLSIVQPVAYATGHCDPVLVGNPIIADGMKQRKIYRFDAAIHVAAGGSVAQVAFPPDTTLAPDIAAAIEGAFQKAAVFVPAVDNGTFVDGVYAYHFEVAP